MDFQRKNYVILQPDQLDDDTTIDRLENTPTFSRNRKTVAAITNKEAAPAASAQNQAKNADESQEMIVF